MSVFPMIFHPEEISPVPPVEPIQEPPVPQEPIEQGPSIPPVTVSDIPAPPVPPKPDVQAPIVIPIVIDLKIVIDVEVAAKKPKAVFTIGPVRNKI